MEMSEELISQAQTTSKSTQDLLDQLLKPEVQESLTTLVEQLPKLAEVATLLTQAYDFAKLVSTDEVLKNDTVSAVKEVAEPVIGTVKSVAANAIEAKERAESSSEAVGIFGVLKLLKDPEVQNVLRFVNAFLQVTAERKNQQ
ncbi:hypothetical protein CD29_13300 [Ureibacillus manganicus DSM 26584]|uniref:DUF1641 domain-containing protein n=2 Tax=Ureibacillus TaxID=160795 RepID=A0A0A3ISR8_9BACL|nr:DUF1641 domain-containing protein [Ureibacillus manganicus]KGR77862.1 hypothetical protein CD29_13300 [Ureibacillus manganicus DSM 26584]